MASFTNFLKLLKKNPATDGKDTFNFETMLNENWDKIDKKVEENSSAIGQNTEKIAQLSNPNLLINGDFQVWQRGMSFTNLSRKYTADRWRMDGPGEIVRNSNGSLKMKKPLTASSYVSIIQEFENDKLYNLKGKKLTLSIKYNTTVDFQIGANIGTWVVKDVNTGIGVGSFTFDVPQDAISLLVLIQIPDGKAGEINIDYVKLELGEIATPFSPRPIGEELAMCQRYSLVLGANEYITTFCTTVSPNEIAFELPLQQRFRTTPSLINPTTAFTVRNLSSAIIAGFTFSIIRITSTSIVIRAAKTSHGITTNNHCLVIEPTGGFDAEIY